MLWRVTSLLGAMTAVVLVALALWGWAQAPRLSSASSDAALATWAVRSGAIAALAAAQVLGLSCLVEWLYERDWIGEAMRLSAGLVCTAALIGAMVLGLVSR